MLGQKPAFRRSMGGDPQPRRRHSIAFSLASALSPEARRVPKMKIKLRITQIDSCLHRAKAVVIGLSAERRP